MATRLYEDGAWNVATPTGAESRTYPFEGDDVTYFFDQKYSIKAEDFAKAATSSAHPTRAGFYLVSESPTQEIEGSGVVEWVRRYSMLPVTRSEYEKFAYQFIGFYGNYGTGTINITGRDQFTKSVMSRLEYVYYLVNPALGADDVPNRKYRLVTSIPLLTAQTYLVNGIANGAIADNPPFTFTSCVPTRAAYQALVDAGTEIVAEDSTLRRMHGNMWERMTRYVKAL